MALIECPECGAQVSSIAESCPKCAYPMAGSSSTQTHSGKVQVIEQTSKRYKLQQLLSSLLIIGSIIVIMAGSSEKEPNSQSSTFGMLGVVVGLIWFIAVRFKIWWHHG